MGRHHCGAPPPRQASKVRWIRENSVPFRRPHALLYSAFPRRKPIRRGGVPVPKIRHLAIKTKDPARLAKFYEEVFELKVIHTEQSGAVYMTDGYFNLAILRNRGEATPSGINHFGFEVEDLAETEKRLERFNEPLAARPATR